MSPQRNRFFQVGHIISVYSKPLPGKLLLLIIKLQIGQPEALIHPSVVGVAPTSLKHTEAQKKPCWGAFILDKKGGMQQGTREQAVSQ